SGALLQWLPPLLFGLWAGVLSDRGNRRLIVVTVEWLRAAILVALSVTIATDTVTVALALGSLFVLAAADVVGTNATNTPLPMLVPRDDLAIANARIQTGFITVNQWAGPPIGAVLFVAGRAWPFVSESVLVATGALLVSRIAVPARIREDVQQAV